MNSDFFCYINEKGCVNMKCYIYGINRVQRDFEYVFDNLEVLGYISENDLYYSKNLVFKPSE